MIPQPTESAARDLDSFPPPPRVHWFVLFLAWSALAGLIDQYAPRAYQELLNSLVVDAWGLYLCLWIRKLDPECKSAFWCDVYLVVEIACALLTIRQNPSHQLKTVMWALWLASFAFGTVTIYLIRYDLEKHYNEREPVGLHLGPVKTFFFSFLYFQSELYDIAQYKRRQANASIANRN